MKLFEIYFSPTGGTKKIADLISRQFGYETIKLDLSNSMEDFSKFTFSEKDLCIIAVPSFGGRVPMAAMSNINKLKGNGSKVILVATYGNRAYEDVLLELKDTLTTLGFFCIAAIASVTEHSIMRQFATGRPDLKDKEELIKFSDKIKEILKQEKVTKDLYVPGNNPYKEYKVIPLVPEARQECMKCGLCAIKCPVNAISKDNPTLVEKEKCISCMRCVAICPNKARSVNEELILAVSKKLEKVCSERKMNELFL
ncbi:4Fe-4S binding protein [Romboutsia sp. 1001216sp1]|nr:MULTISPECIES: 4Fe-4S binding protein [Romboutsia]MDB8803666.1 4Fe-4S binding protein [Romboutsia sp. 1001216sp1]MDB8807832.1 4Fe-4S binding protein [Romboutsia sp. 1001216sp1]MDB8809313.1 4Fe-4S binding protein [Romboutsia sp. 1001216sp1]MDB8815062.1 4Fe-4S binding protein [Romboutsia sp. 1001216sp1]MDB8817755.1 4Fe-4S binding protein [Romboutsia sp. 1001216sp1]